MTLFAELRRRNVIRMAGLYLVAAWLMLQVAETLLPIFDTPGWVLKSLVVLIAIGFVPALVFSWVFELTPDGLKRDDEIPRGRSIAPETGKRMDRLLVLGLVAVVLVVAADRFVWPAPFPAPETGVLTGLDPNAATDDAAQSLAASSGNQRSESIAVLPFANLGGRAEDEYFSDGMTEELLNVLARNTRLKVAARTSVFQYKDRGGDVREIGRALGVGYIVEGSVRRDRERVRITAQLIRVADGFHVWSETWDRELESVFALQDEIAQSLGEQLNSTLGGDARIQSRRDVHPAAYDDFLRARALYRERRNILMALQLFRSAVAREPRFAAAWANLALACEVAAYHTTAMQQQIVGDRVTCMQEAAARASELAPAAAITLHAQANLARSEGRFLDAERLYRESIARDDTYPDVREDLSELLTDVGRYTEAREVGRALVALEPTSPLFWFRLVMIGTLDDDPVLVDEALARIAAIDASYLYAITTRFRHALCQGRTDEARRELQGAYARSPDAVAFLVSLFGWSQRDAGIDDALAREFLRSTYLIDAPKLIAATGDADLFFEVLTNPRDRDKHFDAFRHLTCPIAAPMLADPRAKAFLREAGFEAYWRVNGWPPQCRPRSDTDFECSHPEAEA
jgi:adenylate cyclase